MTQRKYATNEVWNWPEFKAFARRLGVAEQADVSLTIHMEIDSVVHIAHHYIGEDRGEASEPSDGA